MIVLINIGNSIAGRGLWILYNGTYEILTLFNSIHYAHVDDDKILENLTNHSLCQLW